MPRRSAASLSIIAPITDHRPPPPDDLPQEQQDEWRAIVNRLPSGWFPRETHALLAAYVGHVSACRRLSKLVDGFELPSGDFGLSHFDKLLQLRERESRALSSLATRMRISQASQYPAAKASVAVGKAPLQGGPRPWEDRRA